MANSLPNSRQPSTKTAVFLSKSPCCQWQKPLQPYHDRGGSVRFTAFLLCRPQHLFRKTAASLQPRRPFFFQNHLVVSGDSRCNLTMTAAIPSGSPPFCCAGHSTCSAKQPSVFNQDGRFSLRQPLLFVAKATNNCLILCRSIRRQGCPLLCSAVHSVLPAKQPPVFNQDRRFSLFNREKKSAEKRENLAYGKRRNAVRCLRRGKRRFILPTIKNQHNPNCRCAALHRIKS